MRKSIAPPQVLRGRVSPPGDKSISHRAVILNSIARGRARIANFSPGADCLSTVSCLRALGITIEPAGPDGLIVHGNGGTALKEAADVLDAGNSGTTIRLLAGLLAAQPFLSILTGDSSLRSRPMARLIQPLHQMGARIWGRGEDTLAPLAIKGGPLHGISYQLSVASAQLKSALLIAGLFAEGQTIVTEPLASRDHTELMLRAMGASLKTEGLSIAIQSQPGPLSALDLHIPGDISSASYWLVAGAIHPNAHILISNTGVNPTRSGMIEVLQRMGARLRLENPRLEGAEPVADLVIESSELRGTEIDAEIVPRLIDEIPVLAVAAAVARGTTVIRGAAELRVKESDRIATTTAELSRMGATIEALPDGMVIQGGTPLRGVSCRSYLDHRLAMSLAVAALVARGETVIEDAEAVDISYPGFWQDLERLSQH